MPVVLKWYLIVDIYIYYRSLCSPVYIGFLDASKAFDKINHWTLFRKLLHRGLPDIVVRLLYVWYSTQCFYVRWGSTLSQSFNVINGVWQGSVISPIFINIYIDDLSMSLCKLEYGCNMSGHCLDHLVYADNTVDCTIPKCTAKSNCMLWIISWG